MAKEREPQGAEHTTHFSFEATAARLGIPAELWEQPAVRQLVSGVNQVDNLLIDLTQASHTSADQEANGTPSLAARYQAAGQLAGIISDILTDGFNDAPPIATTPEWRNDIRELAGRALGRYGLSVVDTTQPTHRQPPHTPQQTGNPVRTPSVSLSREEVALEGRAVMERMEADARERQRQWEQWKAEGKNPWYESYKDRLDKLPPAVREVIENMKDEY